jgi:adenine phosphoribosyltransferase
MTVTEELKQVIRDVPDFPKPGILFKDITPLLENQALCTRIVDHFSAVFADAIPDAIVGVESRGFFFGILLANRWKIPFIPVRKAGKLPYKTISHSYELEYGSATVEMHTGSLQPGWKVMIHDDLLATGGTAAAAAELVKQCGATTTSFTFLVSLDFLNGNDKLKHYTHKIVSVLNYS